MKKTGVGKEGRIIVIGCGWGGVEDGADVSVVCNKDWGRTLKNRAQQKLKFGAK